MMTIEIPDSMFEGLFKPFAEKIVQKAIEKVDLENMARCLVRSIISDQKDDIIAAAVDGAINSITLRMVKVELFKTFLEEKGLK